MYNIDLICLTMHGYSVPCYKPIGIQEPNSRVFQGRARSRVAIIVI